ncbi:MAG: von Willebrand factor type A domain-containing protein [Bacteroidota bacterium]
MVDENGKALVGTVVTEKGTGSTTPANANGDYTITVRSEHAVLVFSALGYITRELPVNGKNTLNLTMKIAGQHFQELGVTGYGGADKSMMAKKFRVAPPAMPSAPANVNLQPLQGSVAGVMITRRSKKAPEYKYETERDTNSFNNDDEFNTEDYDNIVENRFLTVRENALSTFSIDVDAASYSNLRRYLQMGQLPPAGAVRIEEMINYFHYDYPQPQNDDPFSINTEISACPWNNAHRLVLIGLQGKKIPVESLPSSNLVFLIDVSGSMMQENKLPLVKTSMKLLVDQLRAQDQVSLVVYAGNAGLVLPATSGADKTTIKDAIDRLEAGGSTAGGQGIKLAYKIAKDHFLEEGNNRVILCTDGDFNVGASSDDDLVTLIEAERKSGVFLTVLGYGMGNYKDNKMEKLADKGNGNHAYIDGINEARKVLVNEFGGTLFTIAKDVKLQVEFNPAKVQAYRLIGYENRLLNKEDFNNDKKDAGELGSGHTVTALYEVIPAGVKNEFAEEVDPLKYQRQSPPLAAAGNEIMNIRFRYKRPGGETSKLIVHPVQDNPFGYEATSANFRFAAAVASFGMLLRNSAFKQAASFDNTWQMASGALGKDEEGYRSEFLQLVKNAQSITRQNRKIPHGEEDKKSVGLYRK